MSNAFQEDLQSTFDRAAQLRRYPLKLFDMIPVHPWSRRKRLATGKVVNLGKAPINARWSTMPINSRKTIELCLEHGRNVGVRLRADQLVIDVDPRNGGAESVLCLAADLGLDLDEWPRVKTGSGGFHCYMRLPKDFAVQEMVEGYPGIEMKSVGRQVVAAGSRHPNGKHYRWSKLHPRIEDGLPMAPTPLLNAIRRAERSNSFDINGGEYSVEQFACALSRLNPCAFRDEHDWRVLMFAGHHATAGEGEEVFVDWSASDPQFAGYSSEVIKRWRSSKTSRPGAVTYRTLNYILRKHGAADAIPAPDVGDDFTDVDDAELEFSNVTDASDGFTVVRGERS
jgi:hypothetical protein